MLHPMQDGKPVDIVFWDNTFFEKGQISNNIEFLSLQKKMFLNFYIEARMFLNFFEMRLSYVLKIFSQI